MKNFKQKQGMVSKIQTDKIEGDTQIPALASLELSSYLFWQQPAAILDPFIQYPITMQPRTYELFHRCESYQLTLRPITNLISDTSVIMHVSYPNELTRGTGAGASLFELAMSDTASFHMLLCSSALYADVISGANESSEASFHKLKAIQEINRRLKCGADASDATIAAVSSLAKVEVRFS